VQLTTRIGYYAMLAVTASNTAEFETRSFEVHCKCGRQHSQLSSTAVNIRSPRKELVASPRNQHCSHDPGTA
jgi:hypothetical protein